MIKDKDIKMKLFCSFCCRSKKDVKKLIAGKTSFGTVSFICDTCTEICYAALQQETSDEYSNKSMQLPTPSEILAKLSDVIEGQDIAKTALSVISYYHYRKIFGVKSNKDSHIEQSNVLLVGPSGTGKTLLVKTLSQIFNVPFAYCDATSLTEVGYVGDDPESCITKLYHESGCNVNRTQIGIVFIDEIDKLRRMTEGGSYIKDVSGEGVQNGLLKLLGGEKITIPVNFNKKTCSETVTIETKNILFICAGSFAGVDKIIAKSLDMKKIGFATPNSLSSQIDNYNAIVKHISTEHLAKYGMTWELLGRLHSVVPLMELTIENLVSILCKKENSIMKQFEDVLANEGVKLKYTEEAMYEIARLAMENKTGARGLRPIVEKILRQAMFFAPGSKNSVINLDIDAIRNMSTVIVNLDEKIQTEEPEMAIAEGIA